MQMQFVLTLFGVAVVGALGAGSLAYFDSNANKRWETSTVLSSRITQNAVAAERFRRANGGSIVPGAITDAAAQIGPYGGDFSPVGLENEAWSVGSVGGTPALCFSATAAGVADAAFQSALNRMNRGFVSSECGVVAAPASGTVVYTIMLQGAG